MEAKLFWISMGCGAYALFLRWFLKRENWLENKKFVSLMHGLFYGLVGVIIGSLLTSYFEKPEVSWKLMSGMALGGFAAGFLWGIWRGVSAEKSLKMLGEDLEWADTGFSAILLAAFIMYFFVQAFKIPSGSMRNTLLEKDHLFVNKLVYGIRIPFTFKKIWRIKKVKRGDVVVFRYPADNKNNMHYGKDFIKRAIGLPGDAVEIRDKKVFVNGDPVVEPYVNIANQYTIPFEADFEGQNSFQESWEKGLAAGFFGEGVRDNFGPVVVPEGHYFVMGDNRDHSFDSRFWGPLPDTHLKGKAWFVYLPFNRMKVIR